MHGDSTPSPAQVKTCSKCGQVKPLDEFHQMRRGPAGRQPRCKACRAEQAVARRASANAQELALIERLGADFWRSVAMGGPDECWEYQGPRRPDGYGLVYLGAINARASRVAFTLASGPIPPGLFVCHHCDNPPCCNPAHLFVGTNRDNILDATRKGRMHPGERTGGALLTVDAVRAMRRDYASGMSFDAVGGKNHVTYGCARDAIIGRTWSHVPGAVPARARTETRWLPRGRKRKTVGEV